MSTDIVIAGLLYALLCWICPTDARGQAAPRCRGVSIKLATGGQSCVVPGSGQAFRDCPTCPEMVVLSKGAYLRGSKNNMDLRTYNEGPIRKVTIDYHLAVGKYEVTWDEWEACITAGACQFNPTTSRGRGRRPIFSVTWTEIHEQYLPWLNQKLGLSGTRAYRLLTEAEWEFAARGVTSSAAPHTNYPWGNAFDKTKTSFRLHGTDKVGSFPPNAFGLYDMHGNLKEWVQDCYAESYARAPTDGSKAPETTDCRRVLRGGAWGHGEEYFTSSYRDWNKPDERLPIFGFRIARGLVAKPDSGQQ